MDLAVYVYLMLSSVAFLFHSVLQTVLVSPVISERNGEIVVLKQLLKHKVLPRVL